MQALSIGLRLATVRFIGVGFRRAGTTATIASISTVIVATGAIAVIALTTVTLAVELFFLLLQTADMLVKGRTASFIIVKILELRVVLQLRDDVFVLIANADGWGEVLDHTSKSIDGLALVAVRVKLFVFVALVDLLKESPIDIAYVVWAEV